METENLLDVYSEMSDDELAQVVSENYNLSQAIISSHPEMAQDAGFELFDTNWAERYWRNIVAEISGLKLTDALAKWAIGGSIAGIANMIISHYALPAVALTGAVALAIILVRAAKRSSDTPEAQQHDSHI